MRKPKVGTRVKVTECSGVDSGKEGVVIDPRFVKKGWMNIPEIPGEYRPWDGKRASRESFIRLDSGAVIAMFNNRLIPLPFDPLRAALDQANAMGDMDRWLGTGGKS